MKRIVVALLLTFLSSCGDWDHYSGTFTVQNEITVKGKKIAPDEYYASITFPPHQQIVLKVSKIKEEGVQKVATIEVPVSLEQIDAILNSGKPLAVRADESGLNYDLKIHYRSSVKTKNHRNRAMFCRDGRTRYFTVYDEVVTRNMQVNFYDPNQNETGPSATFEAEDCITTTLTRGDVPDCDAREAW